MDYSRHWLYIEDDIQEKLGKLKILVAGVGIGSNFAELAIRTGINNLIIADGDRIEEHNLSRQNYTYHDIGQKKVIKCLDRLKSINPQANIKVIDGYLTNDNIENLIKEVDIVVNTIDFECIDLDYFSVSDLCRKHNVIEMFPLNIGYGSTLSVFYPESTTFKKYFNVSNSQDLKINIANHYAKNKKMGPYIKNIMKTYLNMGDNKPQYDPQLCISSWCTVSLIMSKIISITNNYKLDAFPKFYYIDTKCKSI